MTPLRAYYIWAFFVRAFRYGVAGAIGAGWFGAVASGANAAEKKAEPPSAVASATPLPAVVALAAREKIPLEGIDAVPAERTTARVGDSIVSLVTMVEGNKISRQWVLQVTAVEMTAEEQAMKPPGVETMYASTGAVSRFESTRQALALRLIGPFASDAKPGAKAPPDNRARTLIKADFLALGMDRMAAALMKLGSANLNYGMSNNPFPPARVAEDKPVAEALGLSAADEQAFAGFMPAMMSFFDVVQKTPGLREILFEMVNKVSLGWTVISSGGNLDPSFNADAEDVKVEDIRPWSLPVADGYRLPVKVSLNRKPALTCTFIVTTPKPPLLACAGVLELVVEQAEKKQRQLFIRVLAARNGGEAVASAAK
ncbi:MAG: hypothetical protein V4773_06900 [Verrucomicrobiota bacterium]